MSLFKLVEAHRGRSRLTEADEDKLKKIRAFFEECRMRDNRSGRCFTIPWLRDWFEQGQSGCTWWKPHRKLMKYVAFLNQVGIPTLLCEPQPEGSPKEPVRPFLYVQMHINLGELPDSPYYLTERAAKEKKLIPEMIKCEFIEPILKAFVLSCYQMIEGMGKSNLVAILDSSGWHAESAKHKLSFRLVMPELAVTLQTTKKIRDKVVFRLRGALRSTKWLNFEELGVEAMIPKEAFSKDMTHPLAFCCWSGKYMHDRRWLRPFALMHTVVEGETCAVDSLNRAAEKLKPADWMRLGSPWSESKHCRPERRDVVEDC